MSPDDHRVQISTCLDLAVARVDDVRLESCVDSVLDEVVQGRVECVPVLENEVPSRGPYVSAGWGNNKGWRGTALPHITSTVSSVALGDEMFCAFYS